MGKAREEHLRVALASMLAAMPKGPSGAVMPLGDVLRQARKSLGLSLQETADAIGCTKSHVWDAEQGNTNPSCAFVWSASRALEIDPAYLLECAAASYTRKRSQMGGDT